MTSAVYVILLPISLFFFAVLALTSLAFAVTRMRRELGETPVRFATKEG